MEDLPYDCDYRAIITEPLIKWNTDFIKKYFKGQIVYNTLYTWAYIIKCSWIWSQKIPIHINQPSAARKCWTSNKENFSPFLYPKGGNIYVKRRQRVNRFSQSIQIFRKRCLFIRVKSYENLSIHLPKLILCTYFRLNGRWLKNQSQKKRHAFLNGLVGKMAPAITFSLMDQQPEMVSTDSFSY